MPPLALHTLVAKQAADCLRLPLLDDERGSLYLGATAPDIRVITRWERQRTHFFDLSSFDEQSGVAGLFGAHPSLASPSGLSARTAAFVAGYVSHLIMDENWISAIYRPYFGERSPLGGSLRANIMDRALQFSLDADARGDKDVMLHVVEAVARADLDLEIDFIDRETLRRWHEVIIEFVNRPPDWQRFRDRWKRHLGESGFAAEGEMEDLARALPELVDEAVRYLTRARVEECIQESLRGCLAAIREYLKCA